MTVYVLVMGESYEGYEIMDIFKNRQDAVNAAKSVRNFNDWRGDDEKGWDKGCDRMRIYEFIVE